MTSSLLVRPLAGAGALALCAALFLGAPRSIHAQEDGADTELRDLAESVATATEPEHAWNDAVRLIGFGQKATAVAVEALGGEDVTPLGRIALARVLMDGDEYSRATAVLLDVAGSDASVAVRVEAVRLISLGDEEEETITALWGFLDDALDPRLST